MHDSKGDIVEPKDFIEVFRRNITEHYFDLTGRVGRKEFWYFVVASIAVVLAAGLIDVILGTGLLRPLVSLALILPIAGLGARRLQDTGRNKSLIWAWLGLTAAMQILAIMMLFWWIGAGYGFGSGSVGYAYSLSASAALWGALMTLVSLASLVISVVLIYFWAQPGISGPNQYGPDPSTPAA
jgi:uncharacterized membrane protein YhaH (DUF805 family)